MLLREFILNVLITKKKQLCDGMEVLATAVVVNISIKLEKNISFIKVNKTFKLQVG